jgi:hypothetical protein
MGDSSYNYCKRLYEPFDFNYCLSVQRTGICILSVNGEECSTCEFDNTSGCAEFNCNNTDSGRAGNTCTDYVFTTVNFLDRLDCTGACNICGQDGDVTNYEFDLGSIIGVGTELTCGDVQVTGLAGYGCDIFPDIDIYSLCCVDNGPPIPTPSPTTDASTCEDFNFDCLGCIEKDGCFWCPGDALCSSTPSFVDDVTIVTREQSCKSPEDYTTDSCTEPSNFFSDPLFSAQKWVFDMINVVPVWEKGYFGSGVRVRINDDSIESR